MEIYLLEQRDVEINVRDKWDSTPLYYACLCGHEELVRYLLANGAKCEANTFDGERCLYGALSDAIRRLLKEYKQITAKCMKRDYYDVFLQRLLEQGYQSDIVFIVHGKSFCAHRCILSARSAYFAEMFETKWKGKNMIVLKHPLINPAAFGALLQYLYTGRLDIDVEYVSDCKRLAKQCRLQDLIDDLETKCKKVYEFVSSKPGTCVKVLTIEPTANCRLQEDLALLADCALPAELRVGFGELPFDSTDNFNSCPDVCFRVQDYNFLCHKAFFCGRSDYFKALLEDHFSESEELQTQPSIPVVTLHNISEDIFIRVLYYIYSDDTELSPENAYDVLCVADMYLLPGLKRLCGRTLAQILDEDNIINIWRIAKLFQLTRLEDQCTEYMAKIIEKLVELEEFAAAVKENAEAVEERQETDSIPLVDDIRFHITSNVQTYSAIEEANQKLEALENLLTKVASKAQPKSVAAPLYNTLWRGDCELLGMMPRLLKQMDTGSGQSRRKAEEEQQCWEAFSIWLLLNNSIPVSLSVEQAKDWLCTVWLPSSVYSPDKTASPGHVPLLSLAIDRRTSLPQINKSAFKNPILKSSSCYCPRNVCHLWITPTCFLFQLKKQHLAKRELAQATEVVSRQAAGRWKAGDLLIAPSQSYEIEEMPLVVLALNKQERAPDITELVRRAVEHQDGQSQLGQGSLDSGNGIHQLDDKGDLHATVVDQGIRCVVKENFEGENASQPAQTPEQAEIETPVAQHEHAQTVALPLESRTTTQSVLSQSMTPERDSTYEYDLWPTQRDDAGSGAHRREMPVTEMWMVLLVHKHQHHRAPPQTLVQGYIRTEL
ncbi:hypothetical protein IHE44_0003521 [Lamprotornis superbus]|uniref:Ankyrin repeat and BTB/POZ domain-containing protein 1 n=1 Tax=Lamprotornis superbus TaxID=245042 RepID=A0A835TZX6_9PASS|nr:hypothetical protein IHE44_0003521 [Lamprotornis superbus]